MVDEKQKNKNDILNANNEPILVGIQTCLEMVFPDRETRPSFRTFADWKQRRYFPSVKIGKRVFLEPAKVRAALERRFEIQAVDVR
ncbi:hypothetical protein FEM03_23570 [Phragmitibacter flavus]|uniref:DNA-binding protein n=2 Tax=Phragmitibacter flavus TaxID=2576071 RepID=A0A5R8K9U6_9BACT|nr:hypothetical protein FEM03_23570 [Phragmitibacter flavus]